MGRRWQKSIAGGLILLAVFAALPRLRIVLSSPGVVDADETTFLLMAKRIAEFRDAPIFYYGQAYMGSLAAYLAAIPMKADRLSATSGRLAPVILSVVFALLSYRLGSLALGRRGGFVAGAYAALAPTLLVVFGAKLFGYMEVVVLGNLLFIHTLMRPKVKEENPRTFFKWWLILGFLTGLGIWCHILFAVYVVSVMVYGFSYFERKMLQEYRGKILVPCAGGTVGFAVGALPLLLFNALNSGQTMSLTSRILGLEAWKPAHLVSSFYNLVVVGLPATLGTLLPWRPFRTEMSLTLLPDGVRWIGFSILAISLILAGLALAMRRKNVVPSGDSFGSQRLAPPIRGRRALLVGGLLLAIFSLVVPWLARSNGGDIREAGLDTRVPFGDLALIGREITEPGVLALILFLPVVFSVLAVKKKYSNPTPPQKLEDPTSGTSMTATVGQNHIVSREAIRLLVIHVFVCCLACVFSSYGLSRSPRFLIPLYSSLPVLFALTVLTLNRYHRLIGTIWGVGIIAINLAVQLSAPPALALQPGHYAGRLSVPRSYDELALHLEKQNYTHVYAPYFAGFPLAWAAGERIAVSNGSEWRIPEFDQAIAANPRVAFVFYRGRPDERMFREFLSRTKTPVSIQDLGSFRIFTGSGLAGLRHSPSWEEVRAILSHP